MAIALSQAESVDIDHWRFLQPRQYYTMKQDQRYQRLSGVTGDEDDGDPSQAPSQSPNRNATPYRDDPSHPLSSQEQPISKASMQRSRSTPAGGSSVSESDPKSQPLDPPTPTSLRDDRETKSKKLRLRRGISKDNMSPAGSRSGSMRKLPLSRESSSENVMILEDLEASLDRLNSNGNERTNTNGHFASTPPRPLRHKDSYRESSSAASSVHGEEYYSDRGDGGSRGEDGDGLLLSTSRGSSFDLLDDDDDEINLQRYNRDFGVSPYISNLRTGDLGFDDEGGMENGRDMYHPRSDTGGSYSKDPYLRMVQHNNPQSPTNGNLALSSVHSFSDLQLYLNGVRRQARQRRAQRLLTMPSEQGWQRLHFWFLTYFWDSTDVGLVVLGTLLVVWFVGLLWLARINVRNTRNRDDWGEQHGAEYNNNAEFDDYEEESSSLYIIFKWLWWILGFVLLVRILGPFAVQNVNNRRRERRRQRYMSGDMQQQQERMQQQQIPTMMVNSAYSDDDPATNESVEGLEFTEKSPTSESMPPFSPSPTSAKSLDGSDSV